MKRVLLISFYYPPRRASGAVRPMGLRKYLPRFGWECVVVTPKIKGDHRSDPLVIETGYVDVLEEWKRKLRLDPNQTLHDQLNLPLASERNKQLPHTFVVSHLKSLLTYPDPAKGWIRFACAEIEKLQDQKIDAIVSSSPPISSHLIARQAKRLLKRPWIADFRDLWTQNLSSRHGLLGPFERILERKTLAYADALVTVSDDWAARLKSRYVRKPVRAITNGFDPDDFSGHSARLTERFSITYTGLLYEGRRDPTPLLEALRDLIHEGILPRTRIWLRFYGPVEPWLPKAISRCGLLDITDIPGSLPRQQAIERQQESQILLQLGWYDPREIGQHTGKLFEYLGSRRPILAVGGAPGAMSEVLARTGAGVHVQSEAEIREYLISAYREFEQNGYVRYRGREDAISQYSHLEMARQFAELLNSVSDPTTLHSDQDARIFSQPPAPVS